MCGARSDSSDFLCLDPLLARVVAAARTYSVRAAWIAAIWARLMGHYRSLVVRAPLQLSALGGSSLGNGHRCLLVYLGS